MRCVLCPGIDPVLADPVLPGHMVGRILRRPEVQGIGLRVATQIRQVSVVGVVVLVVAREFCASFGTSPFMRYAGAPQQKPRQDRHRH